MDNIEPENTFDDHRMNPPLWNWKDLLLILISIVVIFVMGIFLLSLFPNSISIASLQQQGPSLVYSAALATLEAIALVASIYFMGMRRHDLNWKEVGLKPVPRYWLVRAITITIIFIPIIGLIALGIRYVLNLPLENPQMQFLAPKNFSWGGAFGMLLMGGLAVPFAEELFFRGVLFVWLRNKWGFWIGAAISAAVFGILHGDVSVAGATFVMGLILAWFYEHSKSLWPPIMIHATYNSIELIFLYATIASGLTLPGG
jgi:membrane protease YdiL (CAAX protease family)